MKNISRRSRHKRNRFSVSAAVRGFTMGKCGLLPQHFHHRINIAVVILLFFNIFCLRLVPCGLKNNDNLIYEVYIYKVYKAPCGSNFRDALHCGHSGGVRTSCQPFPITQWNCCKNSLSIHCLIHSCQMAEQE